MKIKKNSNIKFPVKIYLDNGRVIPVPSQHDFKSEFVQRHGCSLVGFYMALRYKGSKKTMGQILRYSRKHLKCYAKFPLSEVAKGINKICAGNPATFYKTMDVGKLRKILHKGYLVLFEEGDPIHTVVLLYEPTKKKLYRFSDGKKSVTSTKKEMGKKCTSERYRGIVIVR